MHSTTLAPLVMILALLSGCVASGVVGNAGWNCAAFPAIHWYASEVAENSRTVAEITAHNIRREVRGCPD